MLYWARLAGQMFGLFSLVVLMDLAKAETDQHMLNKQQ